MHDSTASLEKKLNNIYDHLYANAVVRTPKAIANEVGKVLRALSHIEQTRKNQLPAIYFSYQEKVSMAHGDKAFLKKLSATVKKSFEEMNQTYRLYEPSDNQIILADFDVAFICRELDGVRVSSKDKDVFGDAMEVFRSTWAKSHGGQFFTDQRITSLAIHLLNFNPLNGDDLVDICAGTGGFLLAGLNRIKELAKTEGDKLEQKIEEIAPRSLKGLEIDEEIRSVGNATLAARIKKDGELIEHANSIEVRNFTDNATRVQFSSHYCVATNPPFGTKITIKDTDLLKQFELSRAFSRDGSESLTHRLVPRPPDILFLEQNIRLLKPGVGRLAIVLPYQILSGPQMFFVRQWLLKKVELLSIIDLPADTFQPHTGTKACLVVARRRTRDLVDLKNFDDPDIFMARPKWIGHDRRGNPVYKKNADGILSSEILSDIDEVAAAYDAMLASQDPKDTYSECFKLHAKQIIENPELRLDAQYYKEHTTKDLGFETTWSQNKSQWQLIPLKQLTNRIFYPGRFTRNYVGGNEDSVPFLGGANITQLIVQTEKRISLNDKKIEELKVRPRWILVTRSGSTGIVSSVPEAWEGYAISEHVIRIVPNEDLIPYEYLYAFLKTDYAKAVMRKGVYGSVIDEITPEYIGNILIPVPKDKGSLDSVVTNIRQSEAARNKSIRQLGDGVAILEGLFT